MFDLYVTSNRPHCSCWVAQSQLQHRHVHFFLILHRWWIKRYVDCLKSVSFSTLYWPKQLYWKWFFAFVSTWCISFDQFFYWNFGMMLNWCIYVYQVFRFKKTCDLFEPLCYKIITMCSVVSLGPPGVLASSLRRLSRQCQVDRVKRSRHQEHSLQLHPVSN